MSSRRIVSSRSGASGFGHSSRRCSCTRGSPAPQTALWRGSPLTDLRYEEFAQSEIRRLEELRADAMEDLLATKLELGVRECVVPEPRRLLDACPNRERLRMLLMVALHRSGRSVEAISAYEDWHRTLTASWGIEPGRSIQRLSDDIRRHAPELELVR